MEISNHKKTVLALDERNKHEQPKTPFDKDVVQFHPKSPKMLS